MKINYLKIVTPHLIAVILFCFGNSAHAQVAANSSFENLSTGTSINDSRWSTLGFDPEWSNGFNSRSEIATDEAHTGSKSLKVEYPANKCCTHSTGGQAELTLASKSEYYLSYWIKFDDNFSWGGSSEGGKLPGLGSDGLCSGGDNCSGYNGFTSRYMWRKDGRAVVYLYHMDKPDNDGEDFKLKHSNGSNVYFQRGEWIHIVQRVKINTVSGSSANSDGELQVWFNNEEVLDEDGLRFVRNSKKIDKLYFSTFHGGDDNKWAAENDSYIWFDDVLVTTDFDDIWDDTDTDNDGVVDAVDGCPTDPDKTIIGKCGCFVPEGACQDCNGTPNGSAYMDFCGNCIGGTTGLPECIDGNLYIDEFDDGTVSVSGSNLLKVASAETSCEELKLRDVSLTNYDPFYLELPTNLDISFNQRVTARVRSTAPVNLRFDLRDSTGLVTNGSNGRVNRDVSGDSLLWEELTFDYSDAAFTDNAMDKTKVKSVAIMLDPGSPGFQGTVYIDYIAFGDGLPENNSDCIAGLGQVDCHGDPNGTAYIDGCNTCVGGNTGLPDCNAVTLLEEQFDDRALSLNGTNLAKVSAVETECEEVRIENTSLGNYDPIYLTFANPVDVTNNPKIVVRARASHSVTLRLDLRDVAGASTNGGNGRITSSLTGDSTVWREYTFDYPEAAFTDLAVDKTQIERVAFMFDPGTPGFTGVIYIDYVAIGDPSGVGNATEICNPGGKPFDCTGLEGGSAYLDDCDVCVGGTTGKVACVIDCHGVEDGSAAMDNCGVCSGGTTGIAVNDCETCEDARASDDDGNAAENARDTDLLTYWRTASAEEHIEFCLGQNEPLNNVVIDFKDETSTTYAFDIESSINGIAWTSLATGLSNSANTGQQEFLIPASPVVWKFRLVSKSATGLAIEDLKWNIVSGMTESEIANSVHVYPNPTKDQVSVRCGADMQYVRVLDLSGHEVHGVITNESQVDLSLVNLNTGTYMVELTLNTGQVVHRKLIKE